MGVNCCSQGASSHRSSLSGRSGSSSHLTVSSPWCCLPGCCSTCGLGLTGAACGCPPSKLSKFGFGTLTQPGDRGVREVSEGRVHLECVACLPALTSKATGSDISLPFILNSPVLTSSSSWAFLWLRQLPGTLLFCLLGVLSPQTFAKLAPSYTNVLYSGKASSGHSI